MTTDTVKNAKMTTESVVNFVFFETLTTEKSATGVGLGICYRSTGRIPVKWFCHFYPVKIYLTCKAKIGT